MIYRKNCFLSRFLAFVFSSAKPTDYKLSFPVIRSLVKFSRTPSSVISYQLSVSRFEFSVA
ncbi:hypothetical protein C789_5504 [Microcystis aeruginosa FACHB-905 = DIANCHI905]|nr:hypothetical protein C789_5504 [Microcystis aeruginosa FACHB-905 = DIANCHI905]